MDDVKISVDERDATIAQRDVLEAELQRRTEALDRILNSYSWRVTKPLRSLQGLFYRLFPKLFKNSKAYRDWQALESHSNFPAVTSVLPDNGFRLSGLNLPKVSVVLPNYNYGRFLGERIKNICNQDFPIYELIILDDASTDESKEVINCAVKELKLSVKLIFNEENSGSVFRQWYRGIKEASGNYVWIAEADDLADQAFLSTLMQSFSNKKVTISYSQSRKMTVDSRISADHYLDYTNDISVSKWLWNYQSPGQEEISSSLAVKNTILNVSAVVFRREDLFMVLEKNLERICGLRICGDWLVYLLLLKNGWLSFTSQALNNHRLHQDSVTADTKKEILLAEISTLQQFAASRYEVDAKSLKLAKKYREHLADYFEIEIGSSDVRAECARLLSILEGAE